MNGNFRNFAIWLVILFMLMGLFQVFQSSTRSTSVSDKSYSQFVTDVEAGAVLVFDVPLPAGGQYAFEIVLDGEPALRVPLTASLASSFESVCIPTPDGLAVGVKVRSK